MSDVARLHATDSVARRLMTAVKGGDLEDLGSMLAGDPALARCVVEDPDGGGGSTMWHRETPLHLPRPA